MWVSSFVAVNELIAVVDAAQVRKEIRMRRGSSGSGRINREAIKSGRGFSRAKMRTAATFLT